MPYEKWIYCFNECPYDALEDLILRRVDLGNLRPLEVSDILLDWIKFRNAGKFDSANVDTNLAQWIQNNWGIIPDDIEYASWVKAWCEVFVIVANCRLPKSYKAINNMFKSNPDFIKKLSNNVTGQRWLSLLQNKLLYSKKNL